MIEMIKRFLLNQKTWGILLGEDLNNLKKIPQPFWVGRADPFIYVNKDKYYILFEEINIFSRIGKICVAEVCNYKLKNKKTLLRKRTHVSFPHLFQNKKNYIIPETHQEGKVELYEYDFDNQKLTFIRNILDNVECVDSIMLYRDKKYWLITTERNSSDDFDKLNIYFTNDLLNGKFQPHQLNPLYSNKKKSRNAGSIFFSNNDIYRVTQDCEGEYGKSVSLNKIDLINATEYLEGESELINIMGNKSNNHTFNVCDNIIVSDYKFKIYNPLIIGILFFKRIIQKIRMMN